jgi:Ribosomal protein L10
LPSEKILFKKQQYVEDLATKLNDSVVGVLVKYEGITVEQDTKLRADLRKAGVEYTVEKNTMLHLAAEKAGLSKIDSVLSGTTALALSKDDYVAPARILCEFAGKSKKFEVKAGFVEGKVIDTKEVEELAKLPSKEVLVATVLRGFNAPITGLVTVLNANIKGLAVALNAIAEKKSA